MRPRQHQLRPPNGPVHFEQVELQPLPHPVVLVAYLLSRREDRLGLAEVDHEMVPLRSLDDTGDDIALAV